MSIPRGLQRVTGNCQEHPSPIFPSQLQERAPSSGDTIPRQDLSGGALGMPTEQLFGEGQGMFTPQSRNPDTSLFEWKEMRHV